MKEETKKRLLLVIICLFTLVILFLALRLNQKRLENKSLYSLVKPHLNEIEYNEISSHIIENPNVIIYVSNSKEEKSKNFEKIFIPVIKKYNLENHIIYININNKNIVDPFYQNAPELIFYSNSEVTDIIDCNTLNKKEDVINLLKERSVIND